MTQEFVLPDVGIATSQQLRQHQADRVFEYQRAGALTVAVVDGAGDTEEAAAAAELTAQVAARAGALKGALAGVLAAADMLADPTVDLPTPDGAMVLARCRAGQSEVDIAYVGDCRAYGWDGVDLQQLTVDHTHGERLRAQGVPEHEAAQHDHKVTTSIARATVATVAVTASVHPVILLTTDGVKLDREQLASVLRDHDVTTDEPSICARAVIAAVEQAGTRDNASVAVIVHPAARRDG